MLLLLSDFIIWFRVDYKFIYVNLLVRVDFDCVRVLVIDDDCDGIGGFYVTFGGFINFVVDAVAIDLLLLLVC